MIERDAMPDRGAHFTLGENDQVMFTYVIDSRNIIGPRRAQKADSEKHPAEWQAFVLSGALSGEDAPEKAAPKTAPRKPKSA